MVEQPCTPSIPSYAVEQPCAPGIPSYLLCGGIIFQGPASMAQWGAHWSGTVPHPYSPVVQWNAHWSDTVPHPYSPQWCSGVRNGLEQSHTPTRLSGAVESALVC